MKRNFDTHSKDFGQLCAAFSQLSSPEDVRSFLLDLCTPNEIQALADRLEVATMLVDGMSYREVAKKTGVSTATITRVGRAIQTGKGYQNALKKPLKKPCRRSA